MRDPNRVVRYRGIERNRIWLAQRAAALNVNRLVNLGLTRITNGWPSPDSTATSPDGPQPTHLPHSRAQQRYPPQPLDQPRPPAANPHRGRLRQAPLLSTLLARSRW